MSMQSVSKARDVMRAPVWTVDPRTSLPDLERSFLEHRVTGFPVCQKGRLVGIVSRSDVVRQLCVERSSAEQVSEFYREYDSMGESPPEDLQSIGRRMGERIETMHVEDVMRHALIQVEPEAPLREVARLMLEHRIHRVPVVESGQLVGIVSSLDLVRLVAEGPA